GPRPAVVPDDIFDSHKTDPEQKVLGHIQFQQFPNCTVRATGIVNIWDPCDPKCEYDRDERVYDIHVLNGGYPPNKDSSIVDLEDIVNSSGDLDYPFQSFIYIPGSLSLLREPFANLGNNYTCVVMYERYDDDVMLGSAPITKP
ncbi:630_t:CDS:2, partial [Ambispora gerdemannii]